MPGRTSGSQQEIVLYSNADGSSTIQAFDVQTRTSSTIINLGGETIRSAQISQDGQWILIVAETNGIQALQLVRVDGQDVQTLYCASAGQKLVAQWSPDQQQIIFSQISTQETRLLQVLPHCTATFYPDEGHFSTMVHHAQDIFQQLRGQTLPRAL